MPLRVLIADNDLESVEKTKECLSKNKVEVVVSAVYDGDNLMDLLRSDTKNLPQLMLVNTSIPVEGGLKALEEIKKDDLFRKIPIIIISTSPTPGDVEKAYDLGASCFVIKPAGTEEWCEKIEKIGRFWTDFVRVPQ